MICNIWRVLTQILYNRDSVTNILKPFFTSLKNNNINDDKYNALLKTFPKEQLEVLYKNAIISEEKFNLLISKNNNEDQSSSQFQNENSKIDEIISGDDIQQLQAFIQEKDIKTFNPIIKPFKEAETVKIPIIQYCIMKRAIKCFKYILVNGYDDPMKVLQEEKDKKEQRPSILRIQQLYKWDCMATAIYFGNKEIIKILEEKGITKGKISGHIEAAILSYRNSIAEEILEETKEDNVIIEKNVNQAILTSSQNNYIKGIEMLFEKGLFININIHGLKGNSFKKIKLPFILQLKILQKKYLKY